MKCISHLIKPSDGGRWDHSPSDRRRWAFVMQYMSFYVRPTQTTKTGPFAPSVKSAA